MRIGLLVMALVLLVGMACNRGGDETPVPQDNRTPTAVTRNQSPTPLPSAVRVEASPNAKLVMGDGQGAVGDVISVAVSLQDVDTGLSGFSIVVSFSEPGIARVTEVSMPEFGLTLISDLPSESVDITAADLPEIIEGAFTNETIATVDVELLKAGEAEIVLELTRLDDDDGAGIMPQIVNGSLTVN